MRKKRLLKRIVLPLLLLTVSSFVLAQNKIISGKVTDSKDGSPIAGCSVVPKRFPRGTTTASGWSFRISVNQKATVLVFSSVGYSRVEQSINGDNIMVSLTANNSALN